MAIPDRMISALLHLVRAAAACPAFVLGGELQPEPTAGEVYRSLTSGVSAAGAWTDTFTPLPLQDPQTGEAPVAQEPVDEAPAEVPRSGRASVLDHTLSLSLGVQLFEDYSTTVRLDSDVLGRGTEIDFADDLGFDTSSTAFRVDLDYRFAKHHMLSFSYFEIGQESNTTIDTEIQFGDQVFPINIDIAANFDVSVAKLAYRYIFLVRDQYEIGASIGLHALGLDAGLSAGALGIDETADTVAPVPVFGLHGAYAFGDRTRLALTGEVFELEFEDSEGALTDIRLTLDYDLTSYLGIGVGYNRFDMDIDLEANDFGGRLRWDYDGILVYARLLL